MWKGVGHIIQGPGIKALASLISERDSNTVVDEFMKLMDAKIEGLQATLKSQFLGAASQVASTLPLPTVQQSLASLIALQIAGYNAIEQL